MSIYIQIVFKQRIFCNFRSKAGALLSRRTLAEVDFTRCDVIKGATSSKTGRARRWSHALDACLSFSSSSSSRKRVNDIVLVFRRLYALIHRETFTLLPPSPSPGRRRWMGPASRPTSPCNYREYRDMGRRCPVRPSCSHDAPHTNQQVGNSIPLASRQRPRQLIIDSPARCLYVSQKPSSSLPIGLRGADRNRCPWRRRQRTSLMTLHQLSA